MAQQVFLLHLGLIRKLVCGSSVESVLPDSSLLVLSEGAGWLWHPSSLICLCLPDVLNSETEKILYVLGQDLIIYDGSHMLLV